MAGKRMRGHMSPLLSSMLWCSLMCPAGALERKLPAIEVIFFLWSCDAYGRVIVSTIYFRKGPKQITFSSLLMLRAVCVRL